jgi:hypothetical protein
MHMSYETNKNLRENLPALSWQEQVYSVLVFTYLAAHTAIVH